ncbi:MAG: hypothetical protein IPJ55_15715 [Chloracidobacterium sp.]|nr:hypothetical protein [Chloracidobacterium sp.]
MRSMTGFGRATAAGDNFSITVELKTVNNRFLDVNLRLSSEVQSLETAIKRTIGNRLSRGRVDVNLQYERNNEVSYEINRPMITGYLAAMRSMKDEFDLAGEPDLNVIARLPNVVVPSKEEAGPEFFTAIETVLADALDDLEKCVRRRVRPSLTNLAQDSPVSNRACRPSRRSPPRSELSTTSGCSSE